MSPRLKLVVGLLLSSNLNLHSSQLITGDANSTTTTTSFAMGPHAFDLFGGPLANPTMYIGANSAVADNSYAVARANTTKNTLEALAPASITLDAQTGQSNPLFGAKINFLKLNNDKPVVVIDGNKKVFKYTSVMSTLSMVSSANVTDTTKATTDRILALEAANGDRCQTFVACTPTTSGANFGATGSGIALIEYVGTKANNSISYSYTLQNDGAAVALDNSSTSIAIGNNVTLANAVDLHWSGELQCLFIGLQAQAGASSGDGARSVVVGKIQSVTGQTYDTITFEKIAPDAAFTGNNQIIGTATANATVSALKLKTMLTSTQLHYLIVAGGNDVAGAVGNKVYALPLVSGDNANKGHLATCSQAPTDTFGTGNLFSSRTLNTAAATSSDLLTTSSAAAVVGAGNLPLNANETITELFVAGDCVYVSIGTTSASDATGTFYAQAIIGNDGLIQNWTPWQRVSGFKGATFGAALDSNKGTYWYLTGANASNINTLKRTCWGTGSTDGLFGGTTSDESVGLIATITDLFPTANGGLFNLINTPKNNPAINDISLLVATGSGQVALINPAAAVAGDFSSALATSTNDVFPSTTSSTTIAAITGDNLTTLGPITATHFATNSSNMSWLVVGGAGGVAILRQGSGAGWSTALTDLSTLTTSYSFAILGDYQYIKKITSDETYLYILTNNKLDRIALTSTNLAATTPTLTTIAQVGSLLNTTTNDCFNDIVVSGDLGLLAGSAGLFRISNGNSIQDTTVSWTAVTIPEQLAVPCGKLIAITPTGLAADLINGGNLYTVSSYHGLHQTIINRFYVKLNSSISDTTIQPLPDFYVKDINSYFINFESFRDDFFTDGALLINSLSKDSTQTSFVHLMQPGILSGSRTPAVKKYYNISATDIAQAKFVSNIVRSSDAGALLISGDFGLRVNE